MTGAQQLTSTLPEQLEGAIARARPVAPGGSRRGVGLTEVSLDGGFWGTYQETNARATLTHCLEWMERLGWLANFDRVASGTTADNARPGWQFSDSEIYKLLEALAWEDARLGDTEVSAMFDALVERIAPAQDDDGYLNTCYGHAGQPGRYSDLSAGHELYCIGHLLQAAVARYRTAGEGSLVEIARRAADHVCREFGGGGRDAICGHPEIEVGLAEFGRALAEPRYTEQARVFIERRGHGSLRPMPLLSSAYFQDDMPVREAFVWRGHAVRALYLAAAAVDVAVDTGDVELLEAIERQWDRSVERRTYITGGMGSRHQDEGFGDDWELPPDRAYCETCAGIASVMVSWRLLLATGEVRYADLIERTLFNVVATSPQPDGQAFFYANPLQQRHMGAGVDPDAENPRAEGGSRAPWFDVSCCPTNVARTLASWHTYSAMVEDDTLTLVMYAAGDVNVDLDGGGTLRLRVRTSYPDDGRIEVGVVEAPAREVTLRLRVPHWATGATLTGPGRSVLPAPRGWVDVVETFQPGDTIILDLPTTPRFTWPHPRVDAVRGTVAVERGPLVLCLESTDLPARVTIDDVQVDTSVLPVASGDGATVQVQLVTPPGIERGRPAFSAIPFETSRAQPPKKFEAALVPYHRWALRGPSTMRIFIPVL